MNIQELDYIDNIILNRINDTGMFDDVKLSEALRCPRILLLSKLERLTAFGYVVSDGNILKLSKTGISSMIPLHKTDFPGSTTSLESAPSFDWHKPYIPPEGWDTEV